MNSGLKRPTLDKRDYSFHKTFGSIALPLPLLDYTYDIGKTMPNQNADGYPDGCTGYTQADISTDEDGDIYKPDYTYKKTCYMENHDTNQGCQIRNSLKSTQVYGLQRPDETTDTEAETHRRGQYFNIYDDGINDWFDSFRNALRTNKRPLSLGTPWLPSWERIGQDGIIPTVFTLNGSETWHNWAMVGEKNLGGTPYLIGKSWQGPNYGDRGFCYFPRETVNQMMEVGGSVAFTFAKANPQDIQTIELTIYETILVFLYRILNLSRYA